MLYAVWWMDAGRAAVAGQPTLSAWWRVEAAAVGEGRQCGSRQIDLAASALARVGTVDGHRIATVLAVGCGASVTEGPG